MADIADETRSKLALRTDQPAEQSMMLVFGVQSKSMSPTDTTQAEDLCHILFIEFAIKSPHHQVGP